MSHYSHKKNSTVRPIIDFSITALKGRKALSIFDFDGTLFRSPAPSTSAHAAHGNLTKPTFAGGLGWFQSDRTLAPPIVPHVVKPLGTSAAVRKELLEAHAQTKTRANNEQQQQQTQQQRSGWAAVAAKNTQQQQQQQTAPTTAATSGSTKRSDDNNGNNNNNNNSTNNNKDSKDNEPLPEDHFDRWFITPTVEAFIEAKARGDVTAILTGREATFGPRIAHLLQSADFLFDHHFLKTSPRGGTVAFKVTTFLDLIERYTPSSITYYEDRPEQGARILTDLAAALQKHCSPAVAAYYSPTCTPPPSATAAVVCNDCDKPGGGGAFRMVFIDPSLSDTYISPAMEAALLADLVRDAEQQQRGDGGGRGRGHWGAEGSRGRGRGRY